ncbi:MAG: chromate transporter [Lachnospiraceae bacterium]|nr:chromate transporter [Lachnospiraceae bacterium]
MPLLMDLFITFAKVGLFTFGGGYAMLSLIENICVEKKAWITHDEMMNITVMAESTPGPVAINCSTYVGYKKAGLIGALVATIGMVLPSFCIIYLISRFLEGFLEIGWVAAAFKGIRLAVGLLILDAGIKLFKKLKKGLLQILILAASLICVVLMNLLDLRLSSVLIMLCAAAVSVLSRLVGKQLRKGGSDDLS